MADPIQIESPQAAINRARFAGKDFFTFVDDIVARIQALFVTEFNDFVSSGLGQMLIDYVSWAAETLSFYIDRQASESFLQTAILRRSVNRLARQIGYKITAAVGASVDLEVNLTQIYGFDVTIIGGFQFQGPNDLIFEAVESVTYPAGEGPLSPSRTVSCIQAQTVVRNFASDGTRNQAFRLTPPGTLNPAIGTFTVLVDAAPWTESEFISFDQTNQYEVDFNSDPPLLRFGDGVAGNIPANGADVRVEYQATAGKAGLVLGGTITDVVTPLVVAFQNIGLTITNPLPSSGGSDRESLESVKSNAPLFFKARNVAVTQDDYIGLSQSYSDPVAGSVAVAQAFVARSAENDLTLRILLDNIRGISESLSANVQAETTTARASTVSAQGDESSLTSRVLEVDAALDAIVTDPLLVSASGEAIDIKSAAQNTRSEALDQSASVVEGKAATTASGASAGEKSTINGWFDAIEANAAAIRGDADTTITKVGLIENEVSDAKVATASMTASLVTLSTSLAEVLVDLDDVDALVTAQFETAIETELDAIFAHVDGFLAADCQSNLVQVPILTKDVDGFLAAPSIALQQSLQLYLEARKEVTQTVEVISGESFLVRAIITGTVGVTSGFVHATVLSNVTTKVDDLLRDRPFGLSLRLSDVYTSIAPDPQTGTGGIVGVQYAVFNITGPAVKVDGDGNLIIEEREVITKGSLTLAAEVAA
jgi:hypothetical protein